MVEWEVRGRSALEVWDAAREECEFCLVAAYAVSLGSEWVVGVVVGEWVDEFEYSGGGGYSESAVSE